ncbi:MAG TPA: DUF3332 family protein [Planctomycetota bacterium]|nr:DUF3332 family protein [Planctomycetota bacterium]
MKKKLVAGLLGLSLLTTSCLGPNNAFDGLHHWNRNFNESKWVNEAVFLGLTIIPVYAFTYLADIVIFNSIEFWGGENPISPPGN